MKKTLRNIRSHRWVRFNYPGPNFPVRFEYYLKRSITGYHTQIMGWQVRFSRKGSRWFAYRQYALEEFVKPSRTLVGALMAAFDALRKQDANAGVVVYNFTSKKCEVYNLCGDVVVSEDTLEAAGEKAKAVRAQLADQLRMA